MMWNWEKNWPCAAALSAWGCFHPPGAAVCWWMWWISIYSCILDLEMMAWTTANNSFIGLRLCAFAAVISSLAFGQLWVAALNLWGSHSPAETFIQSLCYRLRSFHVQTLQTLASFLLRHSWGQSRIDYWVEWNGRDFFLFAHLGRICLAPRKKAL